MAAAPVDADAVAAGARRLLAPAEAGEDEAVERDPDEPVAPVARRDVVPPSSSAPSSASVADAVERPEGLGEEDERRPADRGRSVPDGDADVASPERRDGVDDAAGRAAKERGIPAGVVERAVVGRGVSGGRGDPAEGEAARV